MTNQTPQWEELNDAISQIMVEFGPDGHSDGSDKITDFVLSQIEKAYNQGVKDGRKK